MSSAMEIDPPEDDDPVIAEYNIFMTPQLKEQLLLMQYHTRKRESPYNAASRALPSELRIKPKTGFVEVDIGVSTTANFDKVKGVQWGQALKHAKDSKAKGFGLSSGFGKGNAEGDMKVLTSGGRKGEDADLERMMREFDTRLESGRVLVKQTLGGQIKRPEVDRPYTMVGTFKGNELHLTEITGTVQMRPQFHHIDAQSSITKTSLSRSSAAGGSSKNPPKSQQPVTTAALQAQRNKGPDDNQGKSTYDATEKFLGEAADENWTRMWYRDEEEAEAYNVFNETMVLGEEGVKEAKELRSEWGTEKYLDAIKLGTGVEEVKKPVMKKVIRKKVVKKDGATGPSRR